MTRLTIELVPQTTWFHNVRSEVPPELWTRIKRETARAAGHRCEICGGRGPRWPVECHERWHYDDSTRTQRLEGFIALCPLCHQVKHIGLAGVQGKYAQAFQHLCKVNGWSRDDGRHYLEAIFEQWSRRSRHVWTLDLSLMQERYGWTPSGPTDSPASGPSTRSEG